MLVFATLIGRKFKLSYLTVIWATLPTISGAAFFTWHGNVVVSSLVVFCSESLLLVLKGNSFLRGYRKIQMYR